jgi:hypothetical protein
MERLPVADALQSQLPPPPPASSADFLGGATSRRELRQQSSMVNKQSPRIFSEFETPVKPVRDAPPRERQSTRTPQQMMEEFLAISAREQQQHSRRQSSSAATSLPVTEPAAVAEQEETTIRARPIPLTLPPALSTEASRPCATTTEGPEIFRSFRGAASEEEVEERRQSKQNCSHFSLSAEWLEACINFHEHDD